MLRAWGGVHLVSLQRSQDKQGSAICVSTRKRDRLPGGLSLLVTRQGGCVISRGCEGHEMTVSWRRIRSMGRKGAGAGGDLAKCVFVCVCEVSAPFPGLFYF